jgi:hypothetical protein
MSSYYFPNPFVKKREILTNCSRLNCNLIKNLRPQDRIFLKKGLVFPVHKVKQEISGHDSRSFIFNSKISS